MRIGNTSFIQWKVDSIFYLTTVLKEITITAKRPAIVKFAAIMAVIVNWTSTFFIFILTCEALIMRRGYMLSVGLVSLQFT